MLLPFIRPRNFTNPTLTDALEIYRREYLPTKAPSTQVKLGRLLAQIERDLGPVKLCDLDRQAIQAWLNRLRQRGLKPGTLLRFLHGLSGVLTISKRDLEWIESNPVDRVPKPRQSRGRDRVLSREEQRRLLEVCTRHPEPRLALLVRLALATGARKGELLALRWEQLDLTRGTLRIVGSKNGDQRSLPLLAELVSDLLAARGVASHGLIFGAKGRQEPIYIDNIFARVVRLAGLKDFHFHDLRHTYASRLAISGASTVQIAELLGHRTMAMVKKYTHLNVEHLRQVQERMGREFLGE